MERKHTGWSQTAADSEADLSNPLPPRSTAAFSSQSAVRSRATIIQRKTNSSVQFEIAQDARASLLAYLELRGGSVEDFAYSSRVDHDRHLSARPYARLVDEWVTAVGLRRKDYGSYSLCRTKTLIIYKATGNLRAIQILLSHSKSENAVRYLGV